MESEINLDNLRLLKEAFDAADIDGSGELDMDEFVLALGPHLGENIPKSQLTQLFMKIDADCGGTVSWDEFTNYFFLDRKVDKQNSHQEWRFFPQDFRNKSDALSHHRDMVDKVNACADLNCYFTCSRDGCVRMWNAADLAHQKLFKLGNAWVNDCIYLPAAHKLACASADHAISFLDPMYEKPPGQKAPATPPVTRVVIANPNAVPLCLTSAVVGDDPQEKVIYGDSMGSVAAVRTPQVLSETLGGSGDAAPEAPKAVENIHSEHSDWVTQVTAIPDLGLMSCALDASIKLADLVRGRVHSTISLHQQGVAAFGWSRMYSLVASGGLERTVLLWQPAAPRSIVGTLAGHGAAVTHISVDNRNSQVLSMAADHVIKVWDLRTQGCLQTIAPADWVAPEDANPTAMSYDVTRKRMVSIKHKPAIWQHKCISDQSSAHQAALVGALVNTTFDVVASGDEDGTICLWDLTTGRQEGHFNEAHGSAKLVAMTFDHAQRRLITGGADGRVCMWNFNSGSMLREFKHNLKGQEICAVLYVHDQTWHSQEVVAGGWDRRVCVWDDRDHNDQHDFRAFSGHREDILSLAYTSPGVLASGDYGGMVILWNMQGSEKRLALRHEAAVGRTAVEALAFLPSQSFRASSTLLTCGGDGKLRVYFVGYPPGELLCALRAVPSKPAGAALSALSVHTRSQAADPAARGPVTVVVGDTKGAVRVWEIAEPGKLTRGCREEDARACFRQVSWWRAHAGRIATVQPLPEQGLILLSSHDRCLSLWTLSGGLVGRFGSNSWRLNDPSSFHDPQALKTEWIPEEEERPASPSGTAGTEQDSQAASASATGQPIEAEVSQTQSEQERREQQAAANVALARTIALQTSSAGKANGGELIHSTLKLPALASIPDDPGMRISAKHNTKSEKDGRGVHQGKASAQATSGPDVLRKGIAT